MVVGQGHRAVPDIRDTPHWCHIFDVDLQQQGLDCSILYEETEYVACQAWLCHEDFVEAS